jgi:hypothetical protein
MNKFHHEYKRKLDIEMQKFTGKLAIGDAETASEMTSATKITKNTGVSRQLGASPDLDEASNFKGPMDGTINDRDNEFNPNPDNEFDEPEEAQDKKDKDGFNFMGYKDPEGKDFDPQKKFGIIEDENKLLYDNITTSYPANLPTEHYQKYIMDNLPKKEAGNGKWFIRPHHLETLTRHPLSVKDDVLNTRYISHYDDNYGKKKEVNASEEAIKDIENHLSTLKGQLNGLMLQRGENPD